MMIVIVDDVDAFLLLSAYDDNTDEATYVTDCRNLSPHHSMKIMNRYGAAAVPEINT